MLTGPWIRAAAGVLPAICHHFDRSSGAGRYRSIVASVNPRGVPRSNKASLRLVTYRTGRHRPDRAVRPSGARYAGPVATMTKTALCLPVTLWMSQTRWTRRYWFAGCFTPERPDEPGKVTSRASDPRHSLVLRLRVRP